MDKPVDMEARRTWYIEARVGSSNYRGDCVRFIDDRRGTDGGYDNRAAEDVLAELASTISALRERLRVVEERVQLATVYTFPDMTTIIREGSGWSVSRWNPVHRESEYLTPDGWTRMDDEHHEFPTADAAFAAISRARTDGGGL